MDAYMLRRTARPRFQARLNPLRHIYYIYEPRGFDGNISNSLPAWVRLIRTCESTHLVSSANSRTPVFLRE